MVGVNGKTVCIDESRVAGLWLLLLLICTLNLQVLHEHFCLTKKDNQISKKHIHYILYVFV